MMQVIVYVVPGVSSGYSPIHWDTRAGTLRVIFFTAEDPPDI